MRRWCGLATKLALLVLCTGLATSSLAADRMNLRYGGDREFPPFEFLDENGAPQGFQVELVRELGRSGDFDVSIALDDWNKTVEAFRAGKLDAIAMAQTRERRGWAVFAAAHATPVFEFTLTASGHAAT